MAHDHDRRYKQLFSHPLMVRRLIESFVDEPFLSSEEIIAVEPVEKETIAAYIESRESDVLWKVRTRTSELYIYVLIEFQSSVEHDMPFRFLEYVARLYQLWLRVHGGTKVPPIFPVLLYNGDERWTAARSTQAMHEAGAMPNQYFPQFSYYPILINEISLESLARIHNAASSRALLIYLGKSCRSYESNSPDGSGGTSSRMRYRLTMTRSIGASRRYRVCLEPNSNATRKNSGKKA